jgi:hypothetical protein
MNRLKVYMAVGVVFVLIVGTLAHFVYGWTEGNFVVGLFVPVNESTWEHMKLVFFPMLLYGAFMENRLSKDYPCILSAVCAGVLSGTWLVAILFYAYSGILGFNVLALDLAVFIVSVIAAFWIAYRLTVSRYCNKILKIQTLLLAAVGVMAVCFMVYSFNPLNLGVFTKP